MFCYQSWLPRMLSIQVMCMLFSTYHKAPWKGLIVHRNKTDHLLPLAGWSRNGEWVLMDSVSFWGDESVLELDELVIVQHCECMKWHWFHTSKQINWWVWYVNFNTVIFLKKGLKSNRRGYHGGSVVKNPPANAEDTGSIPGPGRSHILWGN